jgi:YidC/Oxa1 family membrane protein insertase
MNKTEIIIIALLVALLLAWGYSQRQNFAAGANRPKQAAATNLTAAAAASTQETQNAGPVALPAETALAAGPEAPTNEAAEAVEPAHLLPEKTVVLSNRNVAVTFSSWGGAITSVEMKEYRATLARDSGSVKLDFSHSPALAWSGVPAIPERGDFDLALDPAANALTLRRTVEGLRFERRVTLGDGYSLAVTDTVANAGSAPLTLPPHSVGCGPMPVLASRPRSQDYVYLGLDSLAAYGGERVRYWMQGGFGCSMQKSPLLAAFNAQKTPSGDLPDSATYHYENPVSWVAAKNKFFVQILAPEDGSTSGCDLHAWRDKAAGKSLVMSAVAASAAFPAEALQPGGTFTRTLRYYVGPKKYALLKELGNHQDEVMEFGTWFGWMCKILLPTLNGLNAAFRNYGVAIILLTLLVRLVFWPLTHKSTEDMKKMQALQPLIAELRQKYKDKPQKLNQETMALYKEHKVNPMSGCLPMAIQIPVFIALYTVLRSAIELRFAPFLWIHDLSEPERLFAGTAFFRMLPAFVDSLNILPLLMTATTLWQQKLTPTTGDPQQQKMMMLMPVFMLFLFYNMASALVLYWTVSQLLAIAQLIWQRRRAAARAAPAAVPAGR